jgi:chemotaxis protein methyltransferase WspC
MSSQTGLLEIEAFLKRKIGLEIGLLGDTAIENALKRRFAATGSRDLSGYRVKLFDSEAELQALIDAVVVPETWFFRDKDIFTALVSLLPRGDVRQLRLLSIPCATGEEPFSMAIALLDAGVAPERFRIDAIDVSAAVLARAERAQYGRNSFRGKELGFRDRYFEKIGETYQPLAAVRRLVHFAQGNLLDDHLLTANLPYDAVFCRNVLIYFDRPTQEQVLRRIGDSMNKDGLLFVGASEQNLAAACDFTSVKLPRSFAFRVGAPAPETLPKPARKAPVKSAPRRKDSQPPAAALASVAPASVATVKPLPFANAPVAPAPRPKPADNLAEARRLADRGLFADAAVICEALLGQGEPDVELLHLLGLVHDAAGRSNAAETYYRKALYLDPDHRDTLAHLSLLLHRKHDSRARMLDARLERLNRREEAQ